MQPTTTPLSTYVETWHPEPVTAHDPMTPGPTAAVSALLDLPEPAAQAGDPLPPLWQWFHFLHWPAQHELGPDGHLRNARFLPPIPDRQRMFAGGRCHITKPLRLGEPAQRLTSLAAVTPKHGRTGELLFITERHEFRQAGHVHMVEEQDIVYRSGHSNNNPHPPTINNRATPNPTPENSWHLRLQPDPTLLFRLSALTANTHRIHYDTPYCRNTEGYPGLVVHGPLLALLMLDLIRRNAPQHPVHSLTFRLQRPVFAGEHILAQATPTNTGTQLHTATHRDTHHATAEVTYT
jgi:hydroxyacyl-ACP dehydratase HTD2-like protein with hotdog domain